MILTCPECRTRYLVPDTAIGGTGRTVRCASCRHSWFQEPAILDIPASAQTPLPSTTIAEATPPQSVAAPEIPVSSIPVPSLPEIDRPAMEAASSLQSPADEANYDAFAHEPPFRPRRNSARRWTFAAAAAAVVMIAGLGAVQFLGTPGLAGWLGLRSAEVDIPLQLDVPRKPIRTQQPSGNELFAVSGRIINPTDETQIVPDILAELRDSSGRVVYGWRITPPVRRLPPKGSAPFDSAEMDVPRTADSLNLSFSGAPQG